MDGFPNASRMIKEVIEKSGKTQVVIVKEMDRSQSTISAYLKSESRVSTFVKILNHFGYEVLAEMDGERWTLTH